MADKITQKTVEGVASLARLRLSPQELTRYAHQLEEILDYVGKLKAIGLKKGSRLEFSPHHPLINIAREDKIEDSASGLEELLANVPQKELTLIRVPTVLGGRDE